MGEKGNTKREILNAALELFSVQGYEATSIAQIADAVGIRKASLYSHFASKQEILDTLIAETLVQYNEHSIFANADWDDPAFTSGKESITPDAALEKVVGHIRFILHAPQVQKLRKLLTIEQFQNPRLRELQTKRNYTDIMHYFTGFMRFLIRQGRLQAHDPEIMAAQFCLPVTIWINLCDREPEREAEVMALVERHVRLFFRMYAAEQQKREETMDHEHSEEEEK